MLALALPLSLVIGLTLGLLGGGGSILTVPILVYVLHVAPKDAIAMSLLVVGVTSVAATIAHARAGRVLWRTGVMFGAAGMAGAFVGGAAARFVPAALLLGGFAAMMLATAVAMLRGRRVGATAEDTAVDEPTAKSVRELGLVRVLGLGAIVGLATGLVGAGGGFVIVPALVLVARVPMKVAVGTSLLVIAMNSFAGFAGHLSHAHLDWGLTGLVAAVAVVGSLVGSRLAARVPQAALRRGFAWFVLAMATVMIASQLPASVRTSTLYQALFVTRWPFWVGGLAIGGFVLAFLWLDNKLLGVSTGCAELCQVRSRPELRGSWRLAFIGGIVLGGFLAGRLAGVVPTVAIGRLDGLLGGVAPLARLGLLGGAGVLIGYGARLANGCTSGHAIVGVAQGARSSLIATAAFMVAGFATTQILYGVLS
jgi:uncharacterized membrane protein YfcA/uncharacterized membrane protein YedE/YeeE